MGMVCRFCAGFLGIFFEGGCKFLWGKGIKFLEFFIFGLRVCRKCAGGARKKQIATEGTENSEKKIS